MNKISKKVIPNQVSPTKVADKQGEKQVEKQGATLEEWVLIITQLLTVISFFALAFIGPQIYNCCHFVPASFLLLLVLISSNSLNFVIGLSRSCLRQTATGAVLADEIFAFVISVLRCTVNFTIAYLALQNHIFEWLFLLVAIRWLISLASIRVFYGCDKLGALPAKLTKVTLDAIKALNMHSGIKLDIRMMPEQLGNHIACCLPYDGKVGRIYLANKIVLNCTSDELTAIVAHEIGHMLHADAIKKEAINQGILAVCTFLSFFCISCMSPEPAAAFVPLFCAISFAFSCLFAPLNLYLGRRFELAADRYACEHVGPQAWVSALSTLSSLYPTPKLWDSKIVRLFRSHPSVSQRIQFAKTCGAAGVYTQRYSH